MDYRPVGAGIQLEIECGNAVVGVEIIVFWDVEECTDGNPVVAVYVYGGIAVNTEDAFIASILALVTDNADLLTGGSEQITIGLATLTALITCNFSISVSGLVVMGNEQFTSTESYTGSFTSIGGGWGKIKGGIAYSESCYVVSVGGNIVGNKAIPSWAFQKHTITSLQNFQFA